MDPAYQDRLCDGIVTGYRKYIKATSPTAFQPPPRRTADRNYRIDSRKANRHYAKKAMFTTRSLKYPASKTALKKRSEAIHHWLKSKASSISPSGALSIGWWRFQQAPFSCGLPRRRRWLPRLIGSGIASLILLPLVWIKAREECFAIKAKDLVQVIVGRCFSGTAFCDLDRIA
jgi:hypothetical protein